MSKVDIAGMIANRTAPTKPAAARVATRPTASKKPTRPSTSTGSKPRVSKATKVPSEPTPPAKAATNNSVPAVQPKWRQCEPQTIYMWPHDVDALKDLARQLQRAKPPGVGERITMATLVRVAVSDLLRNKTRLDGTTEAQLLDSLRNS
jgi:hypothetical protein